MGALEPDFFGASEFYTLTPAFGGSHLNIARSAHKPSHSFLTTAVVGECYRLGLVKEQS